METAALFALALAVFAAGVGLGRFLTRADAQKADLALSDARMLYNHAQQEHSQARAYRTRSEAMVREADDLISEADEVSADVTAMSKDVDDCLRDLRKTAAIDTIAVALRYAPLVDAAKKGAALFREYTAHHNAAGNKEKAQRNAEAAVAIEAALLKLKGHHPDVLGSDAPRGGGDFH